MKKYSIINQVSPLALEQMPRFCWKPGETFRYESQWSLLNKFCFWNVIPLSSILPVSETYRILNLSPLQIAEADGSAYLAQDNGYFGDFSLRYCASCMKNQYHSQIFQLLFIEKCPIHKEPLLERCISCGEGIPYWDIGKRLRPYFCSCGYPIWSEGPRSKKNGLRLTNELIMSSFKPTLNWLARKDICKLRRYTESASFEYGCRTNEHVVNYACYWGAILGDGPPATFVRNTKLRHQKVLIEAPYKMAKKSRGSRFETETNHILNCGKIYEAAKQHILTKAIRHHDECIKLAVKCIRWDVMANFTPNLCCMWAQTYILWQMYWEGKYIPEELGNDKSEYARSEHIYKLYTGGHGLELRRFYRIRNADLERNLYLFRQFIYSSFWMCAHEVRRRIVEEDYGWDYFHLLRRNYPFAIALPKKLAGKTIIHLWLPKKLPVNAKQEKGHAHYAKLRNQLDKILKFRLKMGWKIISSGPSIHRVFSVR